MQRIPLHESETCVPIEMDVAEFTLQRGVVEEVLFFPLLCLLLLLGILIHVFTMYVHTYVGALNDDVGGSG